MACICFVWGEGAECEVAASRLTHTGLGGQRMQLSSGAVSWMTCMVQGCCHLYADGWDGGVACGRAKVLRAHVMCGACMLVVCAVCWAASGLLVGRRRHGAVHCFAALHAAM